MAPNNPADRPNVPDTFTSLPPIQDLLYTETSSLQNETIRECLPCLAGSVATLFAYNEYGVSGLARENHVRFLHNSLNTLPAAFVAYDAARPWIIYWALTGLCLLGEDITCYRESGWAKLNKAMVGFEYALKERKTYDSRAPKLVIHFPQLGKLLALSIPLCNEWRIQRLDESTQTAVPLNSPKRTSLDLTPVQLTLTSNVSEASPRPVLCFPQEDYYCSVEGKLLTIESMLAPSRQHSRCYDAKERLAAGLHNGYTTTVLPISLSHVYSDRDSYEWDEQLFHGDKRLAVSAVAILVITLKRAERPAHVSDRMLYEAL
ncbi:MAG: hypothetical protein Q9167_002957 [Letrouitia subvulpina]